MLELWSVDVPWACFGIVTQDSIVVEAAPIAGWSHGKDINYVLNYFRRKGGKVELVWRKP